MNRREKKAVIEIYLLEQLEGFDRCGTLSAAAEELHLSQPALTRSMKKLEEIIGVELFTRQKNRLSLNENGKLAAEYARRILKEDKEIVERIRAFDRSRRTISIGSCAPVPLEKIVPSITMLYPGMTISQFVDDDTRILKRMEEGELNLMILHEEPKDDGLVHVPCGGEKLYIAMPKTNPLSRHEGLWLKDLEGISILLFSQIGFWYELCRQKIPHPRFLMQDDFNTFGELAYASSLPVFTTDHWLSMNEERSNERIVIPILDEDATVSYYLACRSEEKKRFQPLFRRIEEQHR